MGVGFFLRICYLMKVFYHLKSFVILTINSRNTIKLLPLLQYFFFILWVSLLPICCWGRSLIIQLWIQCILGIHLSAFQLMPTTSSSPPEDLELLNPKTLALFNLSLHRYCLLVGRDETGLPFQLLPSP